MGSAALGFDNFSSFSQSKLYSTLPEKMEFSFHAFSYVDSRNEVRQRNRISMHNRKRNVDTSKQTLTTEAPKVRLVSSKFTLTALCFQILSPCSLSEESEFHSVWLYAENVQLMHDCVLNNCTWEQQE